MAHIQAWIPRGKVWGWDELGDSYIHYGLPRWLSGKESACHCRRCGFIPWVWKIPAGGNGSPLQYSCLENSMDGGTWKAAVHRVWKSWDVTEWLITQGEKYTDRQFVAVGGLKALIVLEIEAIRLLWCSSHTSWNVKWSRMGALQQNLPLRGWRGLFGEKHKVE